MPDKTRELTIQSLVLVEMRYLVVQKTRELQALKGLQGVVGMSATHPTWQKTRPDDDSDG